MSWNGKWQCVKGMVGSGDSHRHFFAEAFGRHIFSQDELRIAMESVVRSYLDDIEGFESEMLVQLRADLADPDRPSELLPTHLRGNDEFRREYAKLAGAWRPSCIWISGLPWVVNLGMLVVSEMACADRIQAAKAAATEMGVNASILGSGVATGIATLGIGNRDRVHSRLRDR